MGEGRGVFVEGVGSVRVRWDKCVEKERGTKGRRSGDDDNDNVKNKTTKTGKKAQNK